MEWIDCKGMTYKELEEIRDTHLKVSHNNKTLFLYDDGTIYDCMLEEHQKRPKKYLLTRAHPNELMLVRYASAMRPVYLDGLETVDPMAAMDTLSSERLSFQPSKETATIKYRQYLWRPNGGPIERLVVNHWACVHLSALEKSNEFVRWVDDDWVVEKVEL